MLGFDRRDVGAPGANPRTKGSAFDRSLTPDALKARTANRNAPSGGRMVAGSVTFVVGVTGTSVVVTTTPDPTSRNVSKRYPVGALLASDTGASHDTVTDWPGGRTIGVCAEATPAPASNTNSTTRNLVIVTFTHPGRNDDSQSPP